MDQHLKIPTILRIMWYRFHFMKVGEILLLNMPLLSMVDLTQILKLSVWGIRLVSVLMNLALFLQRLLYTNHSNHKKMEKGLGLASSVRAILLLHTIKIKSMITFWGKEKKQDRVTKMGLKTSSDNFHWRFFRLNLSFIWKKKKICKS